MANAFVFPGGRVDAADAVADPADAATATDPLYPARRAAARELAEEVGLQVGELGQLVRFAHWITPSAEPKRFDTEFFLWPLRAPLAVQVDGREVFDPLWITPAAALARYAEGTLNLPPPTVCTLEDLAAEIAVAQADVTVAADGVDDASAALLAALLTRCAVRQPLPSLPKFCATDNGELSIVMPWDPQYPELPGEGQPFPALAHGASPVPRRIRRCQLKLLEATASVASPTASQVPWTVERAEL